MESVLMCWSGGKDSAMALQALRSDPRFHVVSLLTTVTDAYDRISMHGVRRELLERQAASLGLPLYQIRITACCTNDEYESKMAEALAGFHRQGVRQVAFGDIFLQDLRAYRERNLARAGMAGLFPIWKRDTRELMNEFIARGFRAVVVCLDPGKLDPSFAGRILDKSFLNDLPPRVDPCGENGEFHTFVFDGPGFTAPVEFNQGEVVFRNGFCFCDLLPIGLDAAAANKSMEAQC